MSLVLVGLWLGAVGVSDLGRASHDTVPLPRRLLCLGLGAAALLFGLVLVVKPPVGWGIVLFVLMFATLTGWSLGSGLALDPRAADHVQKRARAVAFGSLVAGIIVAAFGVEVIDHYVVWPSWLDQSITSRWPAPDLMVALGVIAAQLVTANITIRLLLDAVGVPAAGNEKKLKGGRVLGPMERILIVGLGGAHELTAAGLVIAAKGLLRFPELQQAQKEGPSDVTEYFLIGSFASWLIALGGAALIYLA